MLKYILRSKKEIYIYNNNFLYYNKQKRIIIINNMYNIN